MREERFLARQGQEFARPVVDVFHQFRFGEQRRPADDANFMQALWNRERAREAVGTAKRIGEDGKTFDAQVICKRENIVGKIQQAAVRLNVGESHAWAIHRNQTDIERLQHLFAHV
jgi:hypothetical protein